MFNTNRPAKSVDTSSFHIATPLLTARSNAILRILQCTLLISLGFYLNGCGVPDNYKYKKTLGSQGKNSGEFYGTKNIQILPGKNPNFAVLENLNKRVQVIDSDGDSKKMIAHHPSNKKLKLSNPSSIAVHPKKDLIAIADKKLNKIFIYTKSGKIKKVIKDVHKPKGIAFGADNLLYVVFKRKYHVEVYKMTARGGKKVKNIGGAGKAVLRGPVAIAVSDKYLYILEDSARRLTKWDKKGNVIWQTKSKGDYDDFIGPSALAIDKDENIYVADMGNVPCVKFDTDGNFVSKIGAPGKEDGQLCAPAGITVDDDGNVYITDSYLNRVTVYSPLEK